MPFPHGRACRCPQLVPDAGLLAFTVDCDHYDQLAQALAKISSRPIRVVEPEPDEMACTGEMICPCRRCCAERQARMNVRHAPQPWDPVVRRAA